MECRAVGLAARGLFQWLDGLLFCGPVTDSVVVPQQFSSVSCRAVLFAEDQPVFTKAICVMRIIK